MGFLDFIFNYRKKKIKRYLKKDALILDVSQEEKFKAEVIPNAINIPLNKLQINLDRLKELGKPFIVCCVSNIPSVKATKFLNLNNIDAINAGNRDLLKSLVKQE
ncbi:MAG: rhodanese-like domain-containing protein [Mangrovimonas sp.]|nr:rhodanese-like domain-containing protein [Mangrovimonas sp.]